MTAGGRHVRATLCLEGPLLRVNAALWLPARAAQWTPGDQAHKPVMVEGSTCHPALLSPTCKRKDGDICRATPEWPRLSSETRIGRAM